MLEFYNRPLWKYDPVDGKHIYAKERSHFLQGFGLFEHVS